MPLDKFIEERITKPLKMGDTAFEAGLRSGWEIVAVNGDFVLRDRGSRYAVSGGPVAGRAGIDPEQMRARFHRLDREAADMVVQPRAPLQRQPRSRLQGRRHLARGPAPHHAHVPPMRRRQDLDLDFFTRRIRQSMEFRQR